jgi:rhodanese-related sulfurtransferase
MKPLSQGYQALVAAAEREVEALSPAQLRAALNESTGSLLLVDVRDVREVKREGFIEGSLHIPRGMLEFWIDPDSPYYRREFDSAESLVLYCNKGWRSALSAQTLKRMGVDAVAHLAGGLENWKAEGGAVQVSKP